MSSKRDSRIVCAATLFAVTLAAGLFVTAWAGDSVYSSGLMELGDGEPPPGFPLAADILLDGEQAGPDWEEIFDANGAPQFDVIAAYEGYWALFFADDVSLGSGFESTALAPGYRVENGVASADNDIGNAYVYATPDTGGDLVMYAGMERLGSGDSYVEFEFNHDHYRLGHGGYGHGVPWEILGERSDGDVLVRISFAGGGVASMTVDVWAGGGWQALTSVSGEGCDLDEQACVIANGDPIDGGPWPNFDPGDNPEEIAVDHFVEFGLNIGGLLGFQPEYITAQIRTPQDIAFGYFGEGGS